MQPYGQGLLQAQVVPALVLQGCDGSLLTWDTSAVSNRFLGQDIAPHSAHDLHAWQAWLPSA